MPVTADQWLMTTGVGNQATPRAALEVQTKLGMIPVVSDKTDNYPVVAATDLGYGKVFTMSSANAKTFTLPALAAGDLGKPIVLVKKGAGKVTVQAGTGQVIADSPTGGYIYDDQAGETYATLTLVAVTTTLWVIVDFDGTWTTGGAA